MSTNTSTYNQKVQIYAAAASLPAPTNETDLTAGFAIKGTPAFVGTTSYTEHEILIKSSEVSAQLTDVKILVMLDGVWRYLCDFPSGRVAFATLEIGQIADAFTIQDIGRAQRIAVEATISAGTVDIWIQALEKRS